MLLDVFVIVAPFLVVFAAAIGLAAIPWREKDMEEFQHSLRVGLQVLKALANARLIPTRPKAPSWRVRRAISLGEPH